MPRKAFVADLQEAIKEFRCERLLNLKTGDEDGIIAFEYQASGEAAEAITIQAIVPGKILLFSIYYLKYLMISDDTTGSRCWRLPILTSIHSLHYFTERI